MSRIFKDWLKAYTDYASFSEAPKRMHFWAGVSAIAGALRRRVWIEQKYFRWHTNMYIIFVAPPGVVSKSTTVAIAMDLLRRVPGINFGPDVITWAALVKAFGECNESFPVGDDPTTATFISQSAMTLESGEFGNLVNPADREQIDLLVALWDGKTGAFKKVTKNSGSDSVENPWINIIACTTPAWIAGNFPEYVIGGGFTSRCLFVYAEEKEKYVAYPFLEIPADFEQQQAALVSDLEHIATHLIGEFKFTDDAIRWGKEWYRVHWKQKPEELDDDRFAGYLARKQTHIHKLAMVMSAATKDDLIISDSDLSDSATMIKDLERDMQKVFSKIGRTSQSVQAERFIKFIHKRGIVPYADAYQFIHSAFPNVRDFEGIVVGAIRAGFIERIDSKGEPYLKARYPSVSNVNVQNAGDSVRTDKPGDSNVSKID